MWPSKNVIQLLLETGINRCKSFRFQNTHGQLTKTPIQKKDSLEQAQATDMPKHIPKFQVTRKRWNYCRNKSCQTCGVLLCLVKEKLLSEAAFVGYFGHVTFLCNKVLLYNIRYNKVNF